MGFNHEAVPYVINVPGGEKRRSHSIKKTWAKKACSHSSSEGVT
jgi:hypothetical protein